MGLKKTKTYKEVQVNDAYHKIHELRVHPTDVDGVFSVHFSVELKANTTAPYICITKMVNFKFDYDLSSADNVIKQAYDYMKTLGEYTGAVDA